MVLVIINMILVFLLGAFYLVNRKLLKILKGSNRDLGAERVTVTELKKYNKELERRIYLLKIYNN